MNISIHHFYQVPIKLKNKRNRFSLKYNYEGLYPTLFPYGMGGVENKSRSIHVSYMKHIRFFLSYHDHRFETNTSFIFVTFNILQRRTACAKARILVSRPYFASQADEINQITASEVKLVLDQMENHSYIHQTNSRLSTLVNQLKTVSGSVMGSNQCRAQYRVALHSQIFFSSLPNIFVTINPCDLHHPLAMKFAGVDLNIDDLMFDQMPKSQERASIVAKHPVAIARFFNKLIETVLSTLIGYNPNKHESNPGGGVLGKIGAYYGTVEESGRGALHLHMLLWLEKNKNPEQLRELIKDEVCIVIKKLVDNHFYISRCIERPRKN
jgi:Helitron helicase-like domain at N-terminus